VINPSSNIASVVLPLPLSPATVIIVGSSSFSFSDTSFSAVVYVFASTPRE
jgi:hypothetical protein